MSAHFKCASQNSRERGEAEKGHGEREGGGGGGGGRGGGGGVQQCDMREKGMPERKEERETKKIKK